MAIEIRQSVKLSQQLMMTPQLQQAIKLLQMSRMELNDFVAEQLTENPILEEVTQPSKENEAKDSEEDFSSEDVLLKELKDVEARISESMETDSENNSSSMEASEANPLGRASKTNLENFNYENILASSTSLYDHLFEQLSFLELSQDERDIAAKLIGSISNRGYLETTPEAVHEKWGYDKDLIEGVLDTIQRLSPAGVGARDLKECLQIQLREKKLKNGIVEQIVDHHFEKLIHKNYASIAKSLKISMDDLSLHLDIIASLDPRPARGFGDEVAQTIIPDVYITKRQGLWTVALNEEGIPELRLSQLYRQMAQNERQKQNKAYFDEKIRSATWIIKSIQQRQRTILKVTKCIVERQEMFLEYGVDHLKPMILKDVASEVGLHESTISRVTNNKYAHTPRGVFELKYFFNSSYTAERGEALVNEAVKNKIRDLILAENTSSPLSDQQIVQILSASSIEVARRTVAKYREQLGILSSSKRKAFPKKI